MSQLQGEADSKSSDENPTNTSGWRASGPKPEDLSDGKPAEYPGGSSPGDPDPLLGKVIGGCEILSLLGRGAMGAVYEARQLSIDRSVALKTIRQEYCTDKHFLQRFRLEAKAVGRFSSRHVVQIHEVGFDQGIHFINMEFVSGGNLQVYTGSQPGGRLSAPDALRFLARAAEGLHEAEKRKIVHRDIKPGNLLLDGDGGIKIADFGIAKMLAAEAEMSMTSTSGAMGTPLYMSPEQAAGMDLDHRSDMYSLGATFFHLLTGVRPVEGESIYEVIKNKSVINYLSPARIAEAADIPATLSRVIEKMTALHPEDRYPSFKDLNADLRRVMEGEEPTAEEPPSRGQERPVLPEPVHGWKALFLTVAAVIVALGAGAYLAGGFLSKKEGVQSADAGKSISTTLSEKTQGIDPGSSQEDHGGKVEPPPGSIEEKQADSGKVRAEADGLKRIAREEISKLKDRLRAGGPEESLLEDSRNLHERLRGKLAGGEAPLDEIDSLLNDIKKGQDQVSLLKGKPLGVVPVEPPFADVARYWGDIQEILLPPRSAGDELKSWLETEMGRRFQEVDGKVEEAWMSWLERLPKELALYREWNPESRLESTVEALDRAGVALKKDLPRGEKKWEALLAADPLRECREPIRLRQIQKEKIAAIESGAASMARRLDEVGSIGDWVGKIDLEVRTDLGKLTDDLQTLVKEDSLASIKKALASLELLRKRQVGWDHHAGLFRSALDSMKGHDLLAATATLKSIQEDEVKDVAVGLDLAPALAAMTEAFRILRMTAELELVEAKFVMARGHLERLKAQADAASYVEECLKRLGELKQVTSGMAIVPRGKVRVRPPVGGRQEIEVGTFFLDRSETSAKEYKEFLDGQEKVKDFEEVKSIWSNREVFQEFHSAPTYLKGGNVDFTLPVENVNYYQASAFLRWKKKSLPTLAEWWLAARGPVGEEIEGFPVLPGDIQRNRLRPRPVDSGGRSRRSFGKPGVTVNHLSGNVAEWCEVEGPGAQESRLVGGSYLDNEDKFFLGEARDRRLLTETRTGFGMRGVVRPEEFFKELLPGTPR